MKIIPAIDIKAGKVVRLFKGRFDQVTEYPVGPLDVAKLWAEAGASMLHVVDLDGAESGQRRNQDIIKAMAKEVHIPIEVGGGIRSTDVVDDFLQAGIARVVLGTRVVQDASFLTGVLAKWGDRIVVSLDCSNGFVAQRGWVETSALKGADFARDLVPRGLRNIIYTDIARDGTLYGPNIKELQEILDAADVHVIASGGVKSIEDIEALLALKTKNLWGIIVGKALYEGALDLKEALKICSQNA